MTEGLVIYLAGKITNTKWGAIPEDFHGDVAQQTKYLHNLSQRIVEKGWLATDPDEIKEVVEMACHETFSFDHQPYPYCICGNGKRFVSFNGIKGTIMSA